MKTAVKGLVRFLAQNPEQARILIVESSGLSPRLESVRRAIVDSHTRGVRQAMDVLATRLPAFDRQVAASCWVGAVYEAVFQWLNRPATERLAPELLAEAIANYNLRALGVPNSPQQSGGEQP